MGESVYVEKLTAFSALLRQQGLAVGPPGLPPSSNPRSGPAWMVPGELRPTGMGPQVWRPRVRPVRWSSVLMGFTASISFWRLASWASVQLWVSVWVR